MRVEIAVSDLRPSITVEWSLRTAMLERGLRLRPRESLIDPYEVPRLEPDYEAWFDPAKNCWVIVQEIPA